MITESSIQLNAQQYLHYFEIIHRKDSNLLKQLSRKINRAAQIIQSRWRLYSNRKKIRMIVKLQRAWRKCRQCVVKRRERIQRFKQTFYKGKIAQYILRKFFPHKIIYKKPPETPIKAIHPKPSLQLSITAKILHSFPSYINLTQTYLAEQKYIQKFRVYQKQRFSSSWQKYEQSLKKQLYKQACKKWVRKTNQIWINYQNKEVNLEQYIQRHVEKLFKREYEKYKAADLKLQKTSIILADHVQRFKLQYFLKILGLNKFQ